VWTVVASGLGKGLVAGYFELGNKPPWYGKGKKLPHYLSEF